MKILFASGLLHDWQWLINEKNAAGEKASAVETSAPDAMDINRLNGLLKNGNGLLWGLLPFCEQLQMEKTKSRIDHFLEHLNISNSTPPFRVIHTELLGIQDALWKELTERKFTYVPTEKVRFFEQEMLFGEFTCKYFPTVACEIKEAGNCLALELNTAAVFHLMRVVETGLRELARKVHVVIPKTPLDYAGWKSVVAAIDTKLSEKIPKARGARQTKALQFLHDTLADFKAFEVERNEVMHARRRYNEKEALGIYLRVRDFMQRLTNTLSKKYEH